MVKYQPTGIGAALHYNNPEDRQSVELQEKIVAQEIRNTVVEVTGLTDATLLDAMLQSIV